MIEYDFDIPQCSRIFPGIPQSSREFPKKKFRGNYPSLPVNDRHARWLVTLQDMTFTIHYVKGEDNVLADLMSKPDGIEKSSFN